MKAPITLADIKDIKTELGRLIPEVKCSHRAEAMARGFGWNSNAAMRTELADGAVECFPNHFKFRDYLSCHGFPSVRWDALDEAFVLIKYEKERQEIRSVMDKVPHLTYSGFRQDDYKLSWEDRQREYKKDRDHMLDASAVDEFIRSKRFLLTKKMRKTINRSVSSYGLKHQAEKAYSKEDSIRGYVCNGMLIAAAISMGFEFKQIEYGPNAFFNISDLVAKRAPRGSGKLAKHAGGKVRVAAWRNMMVAAINEGLRQRIFGLEVGQNYSVGRRSHYRFQVDEIPAIASAQDAGYGELLINVAFWPTDDAENSIVAANSGLYAGMAFSSGWLERKDGKWLQDNSYPLAAFAKNTQIYIQKLDVEPLGYRSYGPLVV